jgi:hypothetical protein
VNTDGRLSELVSFHKSSEINDAFTKFSVIRVICDILEKNLRIAENRNKISTVKTDVEAKANILAKWLKLADSIVGFKTDNIISLLRLDLQYTVLNEEERESILNDKGLKNIKLIHSRLVKVYENIKKENLIVHKSAGVVSHRKCYGW